MSNTFNKVFKIRGLEAKISEKVSKGRQLTIAFKSIEKVELAIRCDWFLEGKMHPTLSCTKEMRLNELSSKYSASHSLNYIFLEVGMEFKEWANY